MVLVIQINAEPAEIHNCTELHVYFDRNIMQLVYQNEQDAINTIELSNVDFPDNPFTLTITQEDT